MKRFLLFCLLSVALSSCSIRHQTVVATPIVAHSASFDGQLRNSGIVKANAAGFTVSASWVARYDALLALYGKRFLPEVKSGDRKGVVQSGGSYLVTAEVMVRFTRMNQWRKAEFFAERR